MRGAAFSRPLHTVDAHDPDHLLVISAKTQFGGGEQPVDDEDVLVDAGIDELRRAICIEYERGGISPCTMPRGKTT